MIEWTHIKDQLPPANKYIVVWNEEWRRPILFYVRWDFLAAGNFLDYFKYWIALPDIKREIL